MTAEIAILTRSAVALAADSAITVRRERVWKNTNKLFSLSSHNDVGVMIFGSGDFCGISWEIVIKQFRKHIGKKVFKTLDDCTKEFRHFLGKFETSVEELDVLNIFLIFLTSINDCCEEVKILKGLKRRRRFTQLLEEKISNAEELPIVLEELTRDRFSRAYSKSIRELLETESGLHVTKNIHSLFITLAFERVRRRFKSSYETGVVFAGYGEDEILPSIQEWVVDGKYGPIARTWLHRERNLNKNASSSAYIIPFAQSDIAYLFLEGMQLDYLEFIKTIVSGALEEKSKRIVDSYVPKNESVVELAQQKSDDSTLVREMMEEFGNFRNEQTIQPMLKIVSSLPKEEMAAMAEALVEITSLRRKIDSNIESVGGPIDVAVISKSDGFIWIKRKHYFSKELNYDFLQRRGHRFEGEGP